MNMTKARYNNHHHILFNVCTLCVYPKQLKHVCIQSISNHVTLNDVAWIINWLH